MKSARVGPDVTPAVACAIVRTDARVFAHARLNETPLDRKVAGARFENYGGPSRTRCTATVQVESPPADIHQLTRCRERWRVSILCDRSMRRNRNTSDRS